MKNTVKQGFNKGFTLFEVLFATVIIVTVLSATLYAIGHTFSSQETIQNLSLAMNAARAEIEKLRNQSFGLLTEGIYTFDPLGEDDNLNGILDAGEDENANGILDSPFDGSGQIEISDAERSDGTTTPNLKNIRVVICWRQKGGRIIGEDNGSGGGIALNGQLDGTEDANGNGEIDSPCVIETSIANMGL